MSDKNMSVLVIIMCKSPVEGQVKTRLMPQYSAKEAMDLHCAMAKTVIVRSDRLFEHVWLAADDVSHPFFKQFSIPMYSQGEGDLGARIMHLIEKALKSGFKRLLFLGTDSPHMQDKRLLDAVSALNKHNIVLGAVEDGGYDLIAMNDTYSDLFLDIAWGSERVLQQTLNRVNQQKLSYYVLEESFDVDTPDMLDRAKKVGWNPNVYET